MKKKVAKKDKSESSPEQITAAEALRRMKAFAERKENFVASIKKSKD